VHRPYFLTSLRFRRTSRIDPGAQAAFKGVRGETTFTQKLHHTSARVLLTSGALRDDLAFDRRFANAPPHIVGVGFAAPPRSPDRGRPRHQAGRRQERLRVPRRRGIRPQRG